MRSKFADIMLYYVKIVSLQSSKHTHYIIIRAN